MEKRFLNIRRVITLGKKREKFTREELENILEETGLSDQCVDAVQAEMQLFFNGIVNCSQVMSVKRVSNKVLIEADEKTFWLSGDNLGTR